MSLSNELYFSILSLDAYNQGYAPLLKGVGNDIGSAHLFDDFGVKASGFYASAYILPGQIIISYRGTDNPSLSADPNGAGASDVITGWVAGAGTLTSQVQLAVDFYTQVTGRTLQDGPASNVVLTGHSLGGGLAGFVGALYGKSAVLFDNMTFENAAADAYALATTGTTRMFFHVGIF